MGILNEIGSTPICEVPIEGNARIFMKMEYENPFGSHYDRVYLKLFKHYEKEGLIRPGDTVLETSSGSAGISFAAIGRELGYKCIVAMPAGGEKAREKAVKECGAKLILTSAEEYVSGFPAFLKTFLPQNPDVVFLNHSMGHRGTENQITTSALAEIAEELIQELGRIDYLVVAVGNGSSLLGPARPLVARGTKVIGFESFQSAVLHNLMYPGHYEKIFGLAPGSLPRHALPGTSFNGIKFPHIHNAVQEKLVFDCALISDASTDRQYDLYGAHGENLYHPKKLAHWDTPCPDLEPWFSDFGRTTRAGLAVARELSEISMKGQNIVVLAYDKSSRYDS